MGLRQCDKCGEMVDEAKAFCPGCGHSLVVEEKRQKPSEFERLDSTVQLGNTMYNQMLSDMGLNIASGSASAKPEKRIEVIAPVGEVPLVPKRPGPKAPAVGPPPPPMPDKAKPKGRIKWIVLGLIAFLLLFPISLLSAISFWFEIWSRLK